MAAPRRFVLEESEVDTQRNVFQGLGEFEVDGCRVDGIGVEHQEQPHAILPHVVGQLAQRVDPRGGPLGDRPRVKDRLPDATQLLVDGDRQQVHGSRLPLAGDHHRAAVMG